MNDECPVKSVKRVTVTNPYAVHLVNERAKRERRTAANAGATTIIEALGKPAKHNFQDDIIEKEKSSQ